MRVQRVKEKRGSRMENRWGEKGKSHGDHKAKGEKTRSRENYPGAGRNKEKMADSAHQ